MSEINVAALAPLFIVGVAFVVYCLVDISRSDVRHLPQWVWRLIVILSIPLGCIVYLLIGREPGSGK